MSAHTTTTAALVGMTVDQLLAADGADDRIPRIVAAAERHAESVIAFAGDPSRVPAFHAYGIEAVAVATDLALLDLGVRQALGDGNASSVT